MDGLIPHAELLPLIFKGAGVTIRIAAASLCLAVAISFAIGLSRRSKRRPIRVAALIYVEFFRGTSVLVQLFFLYFILPLYGIRIGAEATAVIGLGLNLGAYGSEIVRSAIDSIDKGQIEAAQSLSLPRWVAFRHIILPQALTIMLPSFGNLAIEMVKATALVSLITISELTHIGHSLINATGQTAIVWLLIMLIYLGINTPLNLLVHWAEKRASRFKAEATR
jgi:polar amino acid transport system permease protein